MKKKSSLIFFLLSCISCLLTGCFDLGGFGGNTDIYNSVDPANIEEYYKAYYESIGDIYMCSQNKSSEDYSLKESFFSKSTVNELTWEDDSYEVPYNEYLYMAIELKKDVTVDSISLYVKQDASATSKENLEICMYVNNSGNILNVPNYDDDVYVRDLSGNITYELDGVTPVYKPYGLKDKSEALGTSNVSVSSSSFESFTIDKFKDGADTINVEDGQYIILCFYNNTGYGYANNLNIVKFTALNLLIRAL